MVALTKENAQKASACIKSDKRYQNSSYEVYYKNLGKKLNDYTSDEVRKQAAENLTLRDVDDILWYCYKNDNVRMAIAQGIVLKEL